VLWGWLKMVRKATVMLLEMAENDVSSFWETVARECLNRMSEDEVRCMALENDWLGEGDFEDDDELVCADCREPKTDWVEAGPNFRLCEDCCNQRIAEEGQNDDS
jgi:hypothetical protein